MGIVVTSQSLSVYIYLVVCTDLWVKELHIQVGVDIVVTSGNGSTLARNARDVGSIPILGTIFLIFVTPMAL